MKTYDVVHYDENGARTCYLEKLENYQVAVEHANCIADCSGMKVIVEPTPERKPAPKKSLAKKFNDMWDLAYVLRNTIQK